MAARTKTTLLAVEAGPPRRSTRVAARLEREKASVPLNLTDTKGRPAPRKKKELLPKAQSRGKAAKPTPAPPPKASRYKQQPGKVRNKKVRRTPLTREALERLQVEIQSNSLSANPEKFKPPVNIVQPSVQSAKSTNSQLAYSPENLDELHRRGILAQQSPSDKPKNYEEIRKAIEMPSRDSPAPDEEAYTKYWKSVFKSKNEQATGMNPLKRFFGILDPESDDHAIYYDQRWDKHVPIKGASEVVTFQKHPKPDCAEGLENVSVPQWIAIDLRGLASPGPFAFPNLTMELKRDGSMFTAYAQNRLSGSIGAQAYHEYYTEIRHTPDESWDIARVGSLQFNGTIVEGNIHWVSKVGGDGSRPQDRAYHMTRVMCNFTTGLCFEDFEKARREARNFRDYFCRVRQDLLDDFKNHLDRPPNRPMPTFSSDNNSESTRAETVILSETSTRESQQRAVAERQIYGGAKRGRGRPRKHVAAEPQGVKKRKQAKSKMVNVHTEISSVEGRSTHGTQSTKRDNSIDMLAAR